MTSPLQPPDLRPPREPLDAHARTDEQHTLQRLGRHELLRLPLSLGIRLGSRAVATLRRALGLRLAAARVAEREVRLPGLPAALDGLRLAQLSDVHCGEFFSPDELRQLVQRVASARPDLVLLTGDLVHRDERVLPALGPALSGLGPPGTVFAVRGNHDRQVDPLGRALARALEQAGVVLLDNTAAAAQRPVSARRAGLWIAGIDDLWEGAPDLEAALAAVPSGRPYLLLSHSPDVAESPGLRAADHPPLLVLSGHTHGGQIVLPLVGAPLLPSNHGRLFQAGLVQRERLAVHVSRGVGVVGPPLRIGAPAEVPILRLTRA